MTEPVLPSLKVNLHEVRRKAVHVKLELTEAQRALLAETNQLASVGSFNLTGKVTSPRKRTIQVAGQLEAEVEYICGVTLEPFPAKLAVDLDQLFGDLGENTPSIDVDPFEGSDMEPLEDEEADVADLAYQLFALALDPYPRRPDLPPPAPEPATDDANEDDGPPSPFAVLKDLKIN